MRTLALDVWQDLRTKRLWPVAAALALAVVAVPLLLMRSPAEEPAPPPSSPSADAQGALAGLAEPVGIAGTSKLGRFEERDPFKHSKLPGLDFGTTTDSAPDTATATSGTSGGAGTGGSGGSDTTSIGGGLPTPSSGGDAGLSGGSSGSLPSDGASTGGTSGGGTSTGGTSGGGSPQPPEIRWFSDEVDLKLRKPDGEVVTRTGLRQLFTPIPEANPVVIFNGVANRDSTKVAAFTVLDPATVDRDDDSCVFPAGPLTCLLFALEEGQQQRIDVGVEHYTLSIQDIRRVEVPGPE
jgi:hypothetical protein